MSPGNSGFRLLDSLAWVRRHLQIDHITIGVVVFVFGFFAAQISAAWAWVAFSFSLLLFTWELRMPLGVRAILYLLSISPFLYWFEKAVTVLFPHPGDKAGTSTPEMMFRFGFATAAVVGLLYVLRHRGRGRIQFAGGEQSRTASQPAQQRWSNVPKTTFHDLGGMHEEKRRIARVVENRLNPERSARHGVVQNGILLYGPRGTGKTAIGEATAGEFKINYWYINPNKFIQSRIGSSEENIRDAFTKAYANRPIVLFLDELDSIGTQRQQLGKNDDVGGAARAYNAIVTELMQCIDRYRTAPGLVIMAATNFYDALDDALIREMRFDEKIRIDLPDENARAEILLSQLSKRPWKPFAVEPFAKKTPGWSAAKLTNLVVKAAAIAASENRPIEQRDLEQAWNETGGRDRPTVKPVQWDDLVLPASAEADLRQLVRLMDSNRAAQIDIPAPTGVLLVGPPGTGKTSVAQLIATQTRRSFYAVSPADVPTPQKLDQIFARARENSPSILFIDEMDGILPGPNNGRYISQYQQQIVEQALMLMSQLDPGNQVFLVGTTNHIDDIDPRVLRGGRFSEKIELGIPDDSGYVKLIERFLGRTRLADGFTPRHILEQVKGMSPADLEAVTNTAKRMALNRAGADATQVPPLIRSDFVAAIQRNRVRFANAY